MDVSREALEAALIAAMEMLGRAQKNSDDYRLRAERAEAQLEHMRVDGGK